MPSRKQVHAPAAPRETLPLNGGQTVCHGAR
jgi:hypothetical protein